jgi:hypothetical protein
MATCSVCGASSDDISPFCPRCGSLPQRAKSFSYGSSIALGLALLALVVIWQLVLLAPPASSIPATPPPPDDAAAFITSCGQPDADKPVTNNGTESRSLLYRKARVKAEFVRPDSSSRWKTQAMLDAATLKPLTPEKLAKRLPCASGKPGLVR